MRDGTSNCKYQNFYLSVWYSQSSKIWSGSLHHCSTLTVLFCQRFPFGFLSSHVCLNPHCKGRRCRFVSETSFGIHLQKSSSCWHFFRSRKAAGDQSSVEFDNLLCASRPIRSLVEDSNALDLSSQRAVPLRCDFVTYDDFSTSGSTAQPFDEGSARRFPVSPHAPHPAGASPSPPVFFPYSTDQKWTVALLKVLDNMNAPDYAFHAILTWARAAIEWLLFPTRGWPDAPPECGATVCNDE